MANRALEAMLSSRRAFAVAAAGCGKTELLGQFVADQRSGRQLVLTHTHGGVAAIKKRLLQMRVPQEKFHLDTIAGWSLRYGTAYPAISGIHTDAEKQEIDWEALASQIYPGAERVCRSALGRSVIRASYDGLLVDEYQDCSDHQHAVVRAVGDCIPYRGVGDPMQTIFAFRDQPCVAWDAIRADFDVVEGALCEPWRWRGPGRNASLGNWLVEARHQLATTKRLEIANDAPVTWVRHPTSSSPTEVWAAACATAGTRNESVVAILKWGRTCKPLARRLGGRWPVVETFDTPDLMKLGATLAVSDGPTIAEALVEFVADRMTGVGSDLRPMVHAIRAGRGTSRFTKNRDHAVRLDVLAKTPTPANALACLEGILAHGAGWWLYRRECVFQLRAALRECIGADLTEVRDAIAQARTRARHRGRLTYRRSIGTPLLVKGLEFDHAVLLWEPDHLSVEGLYVALTRASKSLTIVSRSRTLVPEGM